MNQKHNNKSSLFILVLIGCFVLVVIFGVLYRVFFFERNIAQKTPAEAVQNNSNVNSNAIREAQTKLLETNKEYEAKIQFEKLEEFSTTDAQVSNKVIEELDVLINDTTHLETLDLDL